MYAIIRAGGKQHKVAEGDVIEVEKLPEGSESFDLAPLLVVADDGTLTAGASDLAGAKVTATVVGEVKGRKIEVMKFRNKTGYRRHAGHRQRYSSIRIDRIAVDTGRAGQSAGAPAPAADGEGASSGA